MRCLVTGCAGFIGSHLVESLLQDGIEVIGVDCFNDNYARPQKLHNLELSRQWESFDFVPIDIARGRLDDLVEGCDTVFHLAAEPGVRASWGSHFETYVRNNVVATQRLLDAVAAEPARRFVYTSSSSIYGQAESFPVREDALPRPFSPYGVTKLAGEHLCTSYNDNFGVNAVMLRYFSVYGPRQRPDMAFNIFCRRVLEGRPISVFGDGHQTRDFTYIADVVRATRLASESPCVDGMVYNIGGGSRVSLNQTINALGEIAGRPVAVEHSVAEKGDVRDTGADTTAARRDLGFAPAVDITDGLTAQFDWTRQHLSIPLHAD